LAVLVTAIKKKDALQEHLSIKERNR